MRTKLIIPLLAFFLTIISNDVLADGVIIIKENKAGFWGFNSLEEEHIDGVSTLYCKGSGHIKPKFTVAPETLNADLRTVNKFIKKLFKKIDRGAEENTFQKNGLIATWHKLEDGRVEITIQNTSSST